MTQNSEHPLLISYPLFRMTWFHCSRVVKSGSPRCAPGWEHEEGENTYLTRVGTSYEFEIGEMTLAPEINFDFVDGDAAFVAGVSLG